MEEKGKFSEWNHVVRENSYPGRWGRGRDLKEALKSAGLSLKNQFTYFEFKGNDWTLNDMGQIGWPSEDYLIQKFVNKPK